MAAATTEKQATFKFFRSFYEAALEIADPAEQAAFFRAICAYALDGEEVSTAGIPAAMFRLVQPVIDKSLPNARCGRLGGAKSQKLYPNSARFDNFARSDARSDAPTDAPSDARSYARIREEGRKEEGNKEEGREEEKEVRDAQKEAFSLFWQAYPRKVGKQDAFQAFLAANVAIHPLLQALERHKKSEEWQRQAGRFIPNPANYLRLRRFEDDLPSLAPSAPGSQTPCDDTMRHYLAALHERRNHVPR